MCSAHGVCDLAFQPGEAAWIIITMAFHSLVPLAVILGHTVWSFSLFYLALTKHRGATGTGEAAEPLNCRPFQEMLTVSVTDYTASLVSRITVVPIERVDDCVILFCLFFFLPGTSRLPSHLTRTMFVLLSLLGVSERSLITAITAINVFCSMQNSLSNLSH